ncbi:MAG TPA: hypothetical protein PLL92_07270 [Alicycliphilus sp.]|nr:hypothetical protein [Alicycliphilus sp.]
MTMTYNNNHDAIDAWLNEPRAESPPSTPESDAAFVGGYYKARVCDPQPWVNMTDVAPLRAARFLSFKHPDGEKAQFGNVLQDDASVELLAWNFEREVAANPAPRTMLDWLQVARERKVAVDEGMANFVMVNSPGQDSTAPQGASEPQRGTQAAASASGIPSPPTTGDIAFGSFRETY